jgi:excisionase family DNA binding protein
MALARDLMDSMKSIKHHGDQAMQENNLFTIDEAARYLHVSRSFLYKPLIENGELVPVHLSTRVVRIPRRALDEYIERMMTRRERDRQVVGVEHDDRRISETADGVRRLHDCTVISATACRP